MKRILLLAALLATPTFVHADAISAFSGNTQPKLGTTRGCMNFAVFDTAGGVDGDHYGTGLSGVHTALKNDGFSPSSKFLYIFQDVNLGPDIASSSVRVT